MRTEQDYPAVEDDTTAWSRYREPRDYPNHLQVIYSDERPDYLVWGLHIVLVLACVVVIVVLMYAAFS